MKKYFSVALLLSLSLVSQAETIEPSALVMINDQAIDEIQFAIFRAQKSNVDNTEEAQLALLNELVNTAMIAQDGEAEKLYQLPEIQAALAVARMRILAEAALKHHLLNHPITDEEIKQAYQRYYTGLEPAPEFRASHILVKDEDTAERIIESLNAGKAFAELAKEKSIDPSNTEGGDIGWFAADQVVKPFSDAVSALKKGQYTKRPVESDFGWHVILLEDKRIQETPSLEEASQQLNMEMQRERVSSYLSGLRDKARIEVIPPPGMEQQSTE